MPAPSIRQLFLPESDDSHSLPLWLVSDSTFEQWKTKHPAHFGEWLSATGFKAERHRLAIVPGADGKVAGAVLGLGRLADLSQLTMWHTAGIADKLPALDFHCATDLPPAAATQAALGIAYGEYRFDRYRANAKPASERRTARFQMPMNCDLQTVERLVQALAFGRDLINTPAGDMGPGQLAEAASAMASRYGASVRIIEGKSLLDENYPTIHAVGRASSRAPRLIDITWGDAKHPKVTIVGKGVCFDTGGLDLKNSSSMLLMKKDMGGAACTLALAQAIMDAQLGLRLRVLVPAVENSVSGDAYRPGDVLTTRKGLTVEIGNTDAEGRLVLCDALAEADREQPDLLIDMATLTGAARIALGAELPALYGNSQPWLTSLMHHAEQQNDPLWHMPLWAPYEDDLSSKIADLNNVSSSSFAGSPIAALFLRRFVSERTPWLHLDLYAWNAKDRPGRPVGGEAQCVRALYSMLAEKFPR